MNLQLYCLYDPSCASAQFKSNRSNKEPRFSCKLPDCSKIKQLMMFVQDDWPQELKGHQISVEIVATGHTGKLCTLNENKRMVQLSDVHKKFSLFPTSGKATLVATIKDEQSATEDDEKVDEESEDSVKESKIETSTANESNITAKQSPQTSVSTKIKSEKKDLEEEIVRKTKTMKTLKKSGAAKKEKTSDAAKKSSSPIFKDETDNENANREEPCNIAKPITPKSDKIATKDRDTIVVVRSGKRKESSPSTGTADKLKNKPLTMQEVNEATPEMTFVVSSPFASKTKKREREEDVTTPKSKFRRHKMGMKTLADENSTPVKLSHAESVPDSPLSTIENAPAGNNSNAERKITRCVDLSFRTPKPSQRWGHTMTFVDRNLVVLIGGQGDKQLSRDSIWNLDPEMRTWKSPEVTTEGAKPEYRVGHTATYDPTMRCIYIYGGSKNAKWFHDVHMFDLDQNKWSLVKTNGKAPTRAYHSATLWRHELWVFGGVFPRPDPQPDGCDNEVQIFSPIMESWYKPIVTGEKPRVRSGHSATLINDLMVVFGGWDFPYCYNDVCILDLTTVDWSTPEVFGEPPKPRSWHASCALTQKRVFIHGGYDGDLALHDSHIFDLETKSWSQLCISQAPSARAGHVAVLLPSDYENQDEDEVLVFGGGDNDGCYFSDMLSFYVPFEPQTV